MKKLLYIFYPPCCVFCNKLLDVNIDFEKSYICEECLSVLRDDIQTEERCEQCSAQLIEQDEVETGICFECLKRPFEKHYDKNISILPYNGNYAYLLKSFKFGYNKNVAYAFVKILEKYLTENKQIYNQLDYITCVPIHKKRLKQRGFNQSEMLAYNIAKILDIEFVPNILNKDIHTKPQSGKTIKERIKLIDGIFSVNKEINLTEKSILIIDDVFTTGSTINRCAKVLKQSGCKNVTSFTVLKVNNNRDY